MDSDNLLGEFLRARREITTPAQVDVRPIGRRRTPGLRREEVAMLAGVSTDYYIRLEQGRERHPSEQVVGALARALALDPESAAHLYDLARPGLARHRQAGWVDQVHSNVARLMECWDMPACVVNHRLDVLAKNRTAAALYDGLAHNDNLLRLALLNPAAHEFYLDWERDTYSKIAHLRAAAGAHCDDPLVVELIEELSSGSEEFRRMWDRHDVRARTRAPARFHHRDVGDVVTSMEVMSIDSAPGQKLIVFQAEPGSPSEEALALLGGLVRREA
ncbi:helix-turn-helix transcriptional regulator [Actinomadura sp. HBU206391]|uniref:helix-turn-helix transcriptional regulator n=1 Tax=Actinomadura sp. HBU206391 TaxID=2731692 RepID=UPI0016500CC7|nr:helix-turn-helix transcriptional regulator [Actinomadura sp. HBU206391]MBC6461664.1 helix-turn-helix domain-containing protein [Actinomadura sp. HBU206391]